MGIGSYVDGQAGSPRRNPERIALQVIDVSARRGICRAHTAIAFEHDDVRGLSKTR
jgi:hypothetical protein